RHHEPRAAVHDDAFADADAGPPDRGTVHRRSEYWAAEQPAADGVPLDVAEHGSAGRRDHVAAAPVGAGPGPVDGTAATDATGGAADHAVDGRSPHGSAALRLSQTRSPR